MVMRELKKMDDVAYIRFASVYEDFQRVDDFRDAIQQVKRPAPPSARAGAARRDSRPGRMQRALLPGFHRSRNFDKLAPFNLSKLREAKKPNARDYDCQRDSTVAFDVLLLADLRSCRRRNFSNQRDL